jgi:pyruvate dehydrogenase E1 component alpha subunit
MKISYKKKELLNLYKQMVLIRRTEESFVEPILNGRIKCPVHLYSGEEAVAVGFSAYLKKEDVFFGNHRSHGHYIVKGGNLEAMVAEIYCKEDGCAGGRGGSMHIIDKSVGMLGAAPIVAGTISLTLGAALGFKYEKKKNVAVAFFGDGGTGEGVLFESINFAALRKLPIIFSCENNYYSTHLPIRETRPNYPVYKIGRAFGIKSFQVDGNDILKTTAVCEKAISTCRKGEGPVFIEFKTYRLRGHVGPSDNIQGTQTDIRPIQEIEKWKKKDPIKRLERYMLKNRICEQKELLNISKKVESQVFAAHQKAQISNFPKGEEVEYYVFR